MVKVLVAFLLTGMLSLGLTLQAQTIISESGRLVFFNSLDSARGAAISRLASLAGCWLDNYDPRDSFPVLLDLRPGPGRSDSLSTDSALSQGGAPSNPQPPELGYDNLFGNSLEYSDSAAAPSDPGQQLYYQRLGLRIHIPDTVPNPKTLLQLLEYGVAHFAALRQMRILCLSDLPGPLAGGPTPGHDGAGSPGSGNGSGADPGPITLVPRDIARILAKPPSAKIRAALKLCSRP